MKNIPVSQVKIFADSANKETMFELYEQEYIKGLTTNPALMHKAGITNYSAFCKDILSYIKDKPISFEVFADDFIEMERQAMEIASWSENVYVKIPITNTKRESSSPLIKKLVAEKIKVNVTAVLTTAQVYEAASCLAPNIPSYISVFAGRIADTGRDPVPILVNALETLKTLPAAELIWASPRQLLDIFQADAIGCHIITVTHEILKKFPIVGFDLQEYSLETVKMFYETALEAGYTL